MSRGSAEQQLCATNRLAVTTSCKVAGIKTFLPWTSPPRKRLSGDVNLGLGLELEMGLVRFYQNVTTRSKEVRIHDGG